MSLTSAPSKRVFAQKEQITALCPQYKNGFSCQKMPNELLTVTTEGSEVKLLYLRSGYSDADSVLGFQDVSLKVPTCQVVPLPTLDEQFNWITVLEVFPASLVFALLSDTGQVLFIKLKVTMAAGALESSLVASVLEGQYGALHDLQVTAPVIGGISLCFKTKRYFFVNTSNRKSSLYEVDIVHGRMLPVCDEIVLLSVIRDSLYDYDTENNILGTKLDVVYYDKVPICRTEEEYRVCSVFGTRCGAFQVLVQNRDTKAVEWWRWTGQECEAVALSGVKNVVGNLVWI